MALAKMADKVLHNLFSKPSTRMYPFKIRDFYKNTRGKIAIDIKLCIFCGICQKKCPTGAIEVNREAKKWEINRLRCITCSACVEACPKKCLFSENQYNESVVEKQKYLATQNA